MPSFEGVERRERAQAAGHDGAPLGVRQLYPVVQLGDLPRVGRRRQTGEWQSDISKFNI